MKYTIDELYEMLVWGSGREEKGIAQAQKMKNLYPFIQPLILPPERSKAVWENCAKVIISKRDEELKPYLPLLFEWLKDLNWPGAMLIFDRLAQIPFANIKTEYEIKKLQAQKADDAGWIWSLAMLYKAYNE